MVSWYWVPVFMLVTGIVVFGLCRFYDKKLDSIFQKLQDVAK